MYKILSLALLTLITLTPSYAMEEERDRWVDTNHLSLPQQPPHAVEEESDLVIDTTHPNSPQQPSPAMAGWLCHIVYKLFF